jgi:hypothetical protein
VAIVQPNWPAQYSVSSSEITLAFGFAPKTYVEAPVVFPMGWVCYRRTLRAKTGVWPTVHSTPFSKPRLYTKIDRRPCCVLICRSRPSLFFAQSRCVQPHDWSDLNDCISRTVRSFDSVPPPQYLSLPANLAIKEHGRSSFASRSIIVGRVNSQ